jgi:hypothetical protein
MMRLHNLFCFLLLSFNAFGQTTQYAGSYAMGEDIEKVRVGSILVHLSVEPPAGDSTQQRHKPRACG